MGLEKRRVGLNWVREDEFFSKEMDKRTLVELDRPPGGLKVTYGQVF